MAMFASTMLLQVFDFRNDEPNYALAIKHNLTIEPKHLDIQVSIREGIDGLPLEKPISGSSSEGAGLQEPQVDELAKDATNSLAVFFGGNSGTCESLAQTVAHSSPRHGFRAEIQPLDNAAYALPKDRPVLIITSTYEGGPPDSAGHFLQWVKGINRKSLAGVQYAVFGCGDSEYH